MLRLFNCAGSDSDNMLVSAAEVDGVAVGVVELVTGSAVVELVAWVVGKAYGLV